MVLKMSFWREQDGTKLKFCVATWCLLTDELNVVAVVGEQMSGFNHVSNPN